VGISVGTIAVMVAAVILITGGFVIDAGPLHLSAHRVLPPLLIASAAYAFALRQGRASVAAADAALLEFINQRAISIAIVLAVCAAAVGVGPGVTCDRNITYPENGVRHRLSR